MEQYQEKFEILLKKSDDLLGYSFNDSRKINFETIEGYKKLNFIYFNLIAEFFESFLLSMQNKFNAPAFSLTRTIIEGSLKSFYIQLIEKENETKIEELISEKYKFPNLYKMAEKLTKYEHKNFGKFGDYFMQFTKNELGTYEKLSYYSHLSGKIIENSFKNNRVAFSYENLYSITITNYHSFLFTYANLLLGFEYNDNLNNLFKKYGYDLIEIK